MSPPSTAETMSTGYSGKPLVKKLGIRPGCRMAVARPPDGYWGLLDELPDDVERCDPRSKNLDFVHCFVRRADELELRLPTLLSRLRRDGMIWVSWPKRASKVPTDVTEDVVRRIALPLGLVDVKVCAIDEVWSGLKLVVRKELR